MYNQVFVGSHSRKLKGEAVGGAIGHLMGAQIVIGGRTIWHLARAQKGIWHIFYTKISSPIRNKHCIKKHTISKQMSNQCMDKTITNSHPHDPRQSQYKSHTKTN